MAKKAARADRYLQLLKARRKQQLNEELKSRLRIEIAEHERKRISGSAFFPKQQKTKQHI